MRKSPKGRSASGPIEDHWRALLANVPDFVILVDRDSRIQYLNHTVAGIDLDDVIGTSAYDFIAPPHHEKMRASLARVFRTGEPQSYEVQADGPNQSTAWYASRVGPVLRGGEIVAATIIATDITPRKLADERLRASADETKRALETLRRTQQELIRAGKLASIGMLVSGITHELNNPISVVYGNLKLIRKAGRLPRRVQRMLRDAERAAARARDIVEGFRDFARDTRAAEETDLNERLEDTLRILAKTMGQRVRVVRRLGRIPPVRCLKGQINQVFFNLLRNAVEAIPGKGTVTVSTRRADGGVIVEVRDTGRGMNAEVKEKLFEPFFTTKDVGKGLGIGLAISAMIVENHGGRITCRSREGRGSTFTVHLPVQTAAS